MSREKSNCTITLAEKLPVLPGDTTSLISNSKYLAFGFFAAHLNNQREFISRENQYILQTKRVMLTEVVQGSGS